jgi:hypothetical protein
MQCNDVDEVLARHKIKQDAHMKNAQVIKRMHDIKL